MGAGGLGGDDTISEISSCLFLEGKKPHQKQNPDHDKPVTYSKCAWKMNVTSFHTIQGLTPHLHAGAAQELFMGLC